MGDEADTPAMLEGVGGTGLSVAAIRARESARPDRLFDDPLAAAFAELRTARTALGEPGGRQAAGLSAWVVARTVFLDGLLTAAGADGGRQVVLLGAGFDARAFRLPWPPGARCFELDTPDVLAVKEQVLAARHARPRCERIPVPCDLRSGWPARLTTAGFDAAQPAAWIAEGLLVYLEPDAVEELITAVTALSAPGSRLGLTFRDRSAGPDGGSLGPVLRRSAAPDDPAGWLAGHGWAATMTAARDVLAAHGRIPRSHPDRPDPPRALLASARLDPAAASAATAGPRPVQAPSRPTNRAAPRATPSPEPSGPAPPAGAVPLPALLAQALTAFTIEFDNEAEHRMPHRTTWGPAAGAAGPWLTSEAMWANFLQFIPPGGIPLREVSALAAAVNLKGLERWGHVVVAPDPADGRENPPRRDWLVRPTRAGRRIQEVCQPLTGEIQQRWRDRLGAAEYGRLYAALREVAGPDCAGCPPYLPVSSVYPADPLAAAAAARTAAGLRAAPGLPADPPADPAAGPAAGLGRDPGPGPRGRAGCAPRGEAGVRPPARPGLAGHPRPGPDGHPGTSPGSRPLTGPDSHPGPGPGRGLEGGSGRPPVSPAAEGRDLPGLLSATLLAWRLEYERGAPLSLPASANVLRVLTPEPQRLRDLPGLAGVAKEAITVSVGLLERRGFAVTGPVPGAGRGRAAWLTERGRRARDEYERRAGSAGDWWASRSGMAAVAALRESLRGLFVQHEGQSVAGAGLVPYPDGWRAHPPYLARTQAMISDPAAVLPHYPMVSHRGGFPDGS